MSRIEPLGDEELSQKQRELLERVEEVHGFIPNQQRIEARLPLVLESLLNLNRRIVFAGPLDLAFLEKVALVISREWGCGYCVGYHERSYRRALEKRGVSDEEIRELLTDWRRADLSKIEELLMEFAVKSVNEPENVTDEDVEGILEAGAEEDALVQLVAFVNLISGYNRFNLVFGTEPDDEEAEGGWLEIAERRDG